jgi:hypothetical protein
VVESESLGVHGTKKMMQWYLDKCHGQIAELEKYKVCEINSITQAQLLAYTLNAFTTIIFVCVMLKQ